MFGEIICSTRLREDDFQLEFGNNNYEHIVKFKISIKKLSNLIVLNMLVGFEKGLSIIHKLLPMFTGSIETSWIHMSLTRYA
jgi:hypothetical protein